MCIAIKSINNIYFIGTSNYNNAFCHLNAIIQLLHGSSVLNKYIITNYISKTIEKSTSEDLISNSYINTSSLASFISNKLNTYKESIPNDLSSNDITNYITTLLNPLLLYTFITNYYSDSIELCKDELSPDDFNIISSFSITYNELIQTICETLIGNTEVYDGYFPNIDLMLILLPSIYMIVDNETFIDIVNELNISQINFDSNEIRNKIYFTEYKFFNEYNTKIEHTLWQIMMSFALNNQELIKPYPDNHFIIALVDVFPDNTKKHGHAINIIKGKDNKYYFIDDDRTIEPICDWIIKRTGTIYEVCIKNIDIETQNDINKTIRNTHQELTPRVSQRYVMNMKNTLSGGSNDKCSKWVIWLFAVIFIIVLIVLIVRVVLKKSFLNKVVYDQSICNQSVHI